MERLTKKELRYGCVICEHKESECNDACMHGMCVWNRKALLKLKEYEDAEEQGLLVKLPCKVGSLVYKIKKDLNQMKRETIEHNGHYYHRNIDVYFITQATFDIEDISYFGKKIFLTKKEAEAALAKMESEV